MDDTSVIAKLIQLLLGYNDINISYNVVSEVTGDNISIMNTQLMKIPIDENVKAHKSNLSQKSNYEPKC